MSTLSNIIHAPLYMVQDCYDTILDHIDSKKPEVRQARHERKVYDYLIGKLCSAEMSSLDYTISRQQTINCVRATMAAFDIDEKELFDIYNKYGTRPLFPMREKKKRFFF
jgi:hypothetical protein